MLNLDSTHPEDMRLKIIALQQVIAGLVLQNAGELRLDTIYHAAAKNVHVNFKEDRDNDQWVIYCR